jgi:putative endonuclease
MPNATCPANLSGSYYEQLAERFLVRKGLKLLCRNYQCRHGEIDLIMRNKNTLIFIEVRFRVNTGYGSPLQTVGLAKQRKIWNTAKLFLCEKGLYDKVHCRFDVIGIDISEGKPRCLWVVNAFSSPEALQ